MVTQVSIVTVLVADQQRALEFWRDQAGFHVRDDQDFMPGARWITVAPAEGQTALALLPASMAGNADRKPGGFSGVSFLSDDIAEDYAELTECGVQFTQPPKQEPWGISAVFADPDGNLFSLVQTGEATQVLNAATR